MATKSSAGWLIIVVALAVPGFMFYNWWARVNSQSQAELDKKVRRHMPEGTPLFGPAPGAAPAPGAVPAPASPPAPAADAAAPGSTMVPSALAAEAPVAALTAVPAAAPQAAPPPPAKPALLKTGVIAQIVIARDPMLSPLDLQKMQDDERRKREAEDLSRRPKKKAHSAAPVAERMPAISLEGIVSTSDGHKAIVNGEMVGEGDRIGPLRILRITANAVVFSYRDKKFVRSISK